MKLSERFAPMDFICFAAPAVKERAFGAVELFVERGVGTLEEFEFFKAASVTIEETSVGLEVFWAADDAREFGRRGRRGDAVEGEEGIREATEVDTGALTKFNPIGGGENFGRRRCEEVAPISRMFSEKHAAGAGVRTRRDHVERGTKGFADGAELAADVVGAWFDPEYRGGTCDQSIELGAGGRIEFVEDMADNEQTDGDLALQHFGRRWRDVELRKFGLSGGEREINSERRMIPHVELGEVLGATVSGEYAPSGHAATATPVEDGAGARAPVAQTEFGEDGVPFPADAGAVGEIVAGEIGRALPIGASGGGAGEKSGAQAI